MNRIDSLGDSSFSDNRMIKTPGKKSLEKGLNYINR